ncbi:MAG: ParB/RepB/Spo0J family partition protein [Caldilineaceae bacterium SB0661_bin_32]|uniref:ParB/RepB/Spo0J family partition protein n=1 Tax=Caldilineaceae bacterium SB0661_bin_32 TaxID=2605255 RepID=A0A6B1DD58_9CHLR|nr:ParB/RepB/Spo0J family partition protein [Caldilineaceae bacterium SB0661_bin_32]
MSRETGQEHLNPRRRHGLGRGLGALLGRPVADDERETEEQAAPADDEGIRELPVDEIEPNPHQPRTRFEQATLVELATSIREHGVIQPLIVAERPDQPRRYWLVAGERRWRAARQAGLAVVPAVVREATSQQLLELALVENLQRDDLSPLEEAAAFSTLIDQFSLTQARVAYRVGKSRSAVANAVRLLGLPAEVQAALNARMISAGHARALLSLDGDEDTLKALDIIVARELNVRQAEELVRKWQEEPPAQDAEEEPPHLQAQVRYWENRFRDRLSTKVNLDRKADGSGRLVIHFYSDEDLETIYREIVGDETD